MAHEDLGAEELRKLCGGKYRWRFIDCGGNNFYESGCVIYLQNKKGV